MIKLQPNQFFLKGHNSPARSTQFPLLVLIIIDHSDFIVGKGSGKICYWAGVVATHLEFREKDVFKKHLEIGVGFAPGGSEINRCVFNGSPQEHFIEQGHHALVNHLGPTEIVEYQLAHATAAAATGRLAGANAPTQV